MKKLASIFLALVMMLSLSVTAFADENTTVTFDDPAAARTYDAYKLLDLTVSLKSGDHHPSDCTNGEHSDNCYNYAYTVVDKYLGILQAETHENAGPEIWGDATKPAVGSVTEKQILDYLASLNSDNNGTFGSLRRAADRIYRAIAAANPNLEADKTNLTGTADIEQGYWMFVDVTGFDNKQDASSLVILDTKGEDELIVAPKVSIPSVEKKVKDIDDSSDANIEDNPWHDSADHDIGDAVPFKLTATLPNNMNAYETYKLIFHDELSDGLQLKPASVKVLLYPTKHRADADIRLAEGVDVTDFFVTQTTGSTFTVSCEDIKRIDGVGSNYAIVVSYEAELTEAAVTGAPGNPNEVYLEFSNDPYNESTGETKKDKVTVFTYKLVVNKIDNHDHPLEGAGFTLSKMDYETGDYVAIGGEVTGGTSFTWKGLDDGDYQLTETTVPEGYNELAPVKFSILATHNETSDDPQLIALDGGQMGIGDLATGTMTKNIVNSTGTILPETGAQGTMMLIGGGSLFVIVAAVFMVTRKKMSVYEF